MFEGFTFEPGHRSRQQKVFYDHDIPLAPHEDGSVSPTDSSSRGSTPSLLDHQFGQPAPTSDPRNLRLRSCKTSRQSSISELSQYFTRQTLQPSRRPSAPSATSLPLMLRAHDPTSLAILNATHARRISRRRPSLQQKVPCSAAHLDRVASLVEQYLDDTSIPSGLSHSRSCIRENDFDDPDDDFHPSVMTEEGDSSSPTSSSFSYLPSPNEDSSFEFFGFSGNTVPPTPPLPGEVEEASSRRGSYEKVMKPVRIRRRTLTRTRLSIGTR